jgi:outer membrane receptor protein involved in Fe transport
VSAAQYGSILDNPAGQYNTNAGGNPDLRAETAKTRTLGIVLEPMANFSAAIDYYQVKIDDVIAVIPPATILDQCLQTGNAQFCSAITRDGAGTLWLLPQASIVSNSINVAKWTTSGIDLTASYTRRLGEHGSLNLNFMGTHVREFKQQQFPGADEYDCAGLFGATCGATLGVLPDWRHRLRGTWATPWNLDLALTWRYISEVKNEASSSSPTLSAPFPQADAKLDARSYLDLAGTWRINKNLTFTGGINNLLDKDPPIVSQVVAGAPFGNGNTYPNLYDAMGRKVFLTLTAKF